jgi:hypothetical protein
LGTGMSGVRFVHCARSHDPSYPFSFSSTILWSLDINVNFFTSILLTSVRSVNNTNNETNSRYAAIWDRLPCPCSVEFGDPMLPVQVLF